MADPAPDLVPSPVPRLVAPLDPAWYGFLIMTFAVVCLAGIFATYACQIPYQRGLIAMSVLDRAASATTPSALAALAPELGDNRAILLPPHPTSPFAARLVAARRATRARTIADAADIARRLRVVVGVIAGGAALFGCMLMSAAAKQRARAR